MREKAKGEPLIFEVGGEGRKGYPPLEWDVPCPRPEEALPKEMIREGPPRLPQVSEVEVVRHFTRLSQMNYGIDEGLYPLGSCTMKYNPKVNEELARLPGFSLAHPYQPEDISQGALMLMFELERLLCEITGMDAVTLQPAAGAQGELTGMLVVRAYHKSKGERRKKVLIPDTAHGTNPASCSLTGYEVETIRSGEKGFLTAQAVREAMDEDVAALMLTNPNTLGIFEEEVVGICKSVHERGGLVYMDGANLNALLGICRPGDTGVDLVHLNLHKTFSTPHGGGGPGAGPVAVKKFLEPFLPIPRVAKEDGRFRLKGDSPYSIGRVRAFYGNFLVLVRAYAYILSLGAEGLETISRVAVLNANYLKEKLKGFYHLPYPTPSLHEFILSDKIQNRYGVKTIHIVKRLMDYGFHPPTIYFPLVVPGAMMIEPTESESLEELDRFVEAMRAIAKEAEENPEVVKTAPHTLRMARLDEAKAARQPKLRWEARGE